MRTGLRQLFYVSLFASGNVCVIADWTDPTSARPLVEHISARELGADTSQWFAVQDPLGRIFVGGRGLFVFDGQSWRVYPIGNSFAVRTIQFDRDRIWVAGANEIGYLDEPTIGNLRYHSLIDQLPESERPVGQIWGSGVVGPRLYFVGREKLYAWNGSSFQIWNFPGRARLFPLSLDGEMWIHHVESGLYRLTVEGPKLEFAPSSLPGSGILGLTHDAKGLLLVSAIGFYRPGTPAKLEFDESINQFIATNRLASYTTLRSGVHAVGTVDGGMILVDQEGKLLRRLDSQNGLPGNAVFSITEDTRGQVWCTCSNGIYHFDGAGRISVLNRGSGFDQNVTDIEPAGADMFVSTHAGVFQSVASPERGARLVPLPGLGKSYTSVRALPDGLLLGRFGGLDFYRSGQVENIMSFDANLVNGIYASQRTARRYLLAMDRMIGTVERQPDQSFHYARTISLNDFPSQGIHEDARGRIWVGTPSNGVFIHDPADRTLKPVPETATGKPISGQLVLASTGSKLIVFAPGRALLADETQDRLDLARALPGVQLPLTFAAIGPNELLLAFRREGNASASAWGQGLGVLTLQAGGGTTWRELDSSACESVGVIVLARVTVEHGHRVLLLGGTEGLLRLDYGPELELRAPATPVIRRDAAISSAPAPTGELAFPFQDHRLGFRVFTGAGSHGQGWRIQTRLGHEDGPWSAPEARGSYEFSNLSEGSYRFEVRAVNAAGAASPAAVVAFRILPPWYRSGNAYLGYAIVLGLCGWGVIRFRERRIRAQNEKLESTVQQRTAELVKANAAKDDFLASVSHEIRNPMNGVIGISESLKTAGLDADSRRKFGMLRQCASHLSSLLEDILDLSKMQAGVIELEQKSFDVPELMDGVTAMAAAESEKYGIPIEVAISPAVPRRLTGDPRRVRQILLNFVGNALKFSGRGQVSVTVWCKSAPTPDRAEVIFAVSDDGPGISPEEQKRLFTRFERGAAARQGRAPGTGLGLALCKGFAEKMGGSIWLESELGQGSSFYFSAQFAVPPESDPAPPPPEPAQSPVERTALVVDDQEYNRIVLVDLLGELGYRVLAAGAAEEAVGLASAHDCELVFLDYDLPGESGLEVARRIRRLANASARARIFATTAFSTPEKQAECLAAGMNAFLGKPITFERLKRALQAEPAAAAATRPPAAKFENLQLLARKKRVPFADELALYFSELHVELDNLDAAVAAREAREAAHYAHLLCGRFSFIHETEMEARARRLEEKCVREQWDEAQSLAEEVRAQLARLQIKETSGGPAAPRE